jgi:hypothetical protein
MNGAAATGDSRKTLSVGRAARSPEATLGTGATASTGAADTGSGDNAVGEAMPDARASVGFAAR